MLMLLVSNSQAFGPCAKNALSIKLQASWGVPGYNSTKDKEVKMSPTAMREIKEWLEAGYAEAQGPFTAEKVGAPDFVIMRTSDFESEELLTPDEIESLQAGYADVLNGKVLDFDEAMTQMAVKYGL